MVVNSVNKLVCNHEILYRLLLLSFWIVSVCACVIRTGRKNAAYAQSLLLFGCESPTVATARQDVLVRHTPPHTHGRISEGQLNCHCTTSALGEAGLLVPETRRN